MVLCITFRISSLLWLPWFLAECEGGVGRMTRYHHCQELVTTIIVEHRRLGANLALLIHKDMLLAGVVGA